MGDRIGSKGLGGLTWAAPAALCVALLAAAPVAASGAASTFTVSGFADGTGSCGTVDANGNVACTTLRAAISRANLQGNSPTIHLQAGTYQLTPGNGGQLELKTSMNIAGTGPGGPGGTTIQQTDGVSRVLQIDQSTQLTELEITGGHLVPSWSSGGTSSGGGIFVQGSLGKLALQNVLVTENQVVAPGGPAAGNGGDNAEGGGIAYATGTPAGSAIADSSVSDNSVTGGAGGTGGADGGLAEGGGLAYLGNGALLVQNTTLIGNSAIGGDGGGGAGSGGSGGYAVGGGLLNGGPATLTGTTVADNVATGGRQGAGPPAPGASGGKAEGGGISGESVDQLVNSTVFGNSAQGGAGSTGGTPGAGVGGGLQDVGSTEGSVLQSDTFAANRASSSGSNLQVTVGPPPNPYTFTIHDTIVTGGLPAGVANCTFRSTAPPTAESNNLEDDSAGSCGFAAANHDLVGANPQLQNSLSNNGGPTQTLAPAPGSPVFRAGGACADPASNPPGQPLTVDQRGEPRATPCDIGAFQAQSPKSTVAPTISGAARRGQTLICNQGTWTGDGSLTYSFGWLRNGAAIAGHTTNTYVVRATDAGQSLACQVIATYYGSVTATSPFVIVPSFPVITVLKVSVSRGVIVVSLGCRGPDLERCTGVLKATAVEKLRGRKVIAVAAASGRLRKRPITLGQHRYSILARHTATVRIALTRNVSQLLEQFSTLPAMLIVTQTTAAGTRTVAARLLRIRRPPSSKGRHRG